VIGATYERDGLPQFHHLDSFFDRYQRSLAHVLPGVVPIVASVSRDRRYFVVVASGPRDPGTYYVLDTQTNTATRIARAMPWLDPENLAHVEAFRVASTDGFELEAFLTRPNGVAKPPLVVLPHGGPRDVRDSRAFDPLVQFLAAGGLAVLQVNFRGSAGRGQAFLDAGKREWGAGIEEDLEAAFDEVVRRGLVDGDRACIAGASYGGYSALMSVIRNPQRYRCAASLNGPTDLPFESNFYFWWDEARKYFEEYIGDPDDPEQLRSISPVYRASEIRVPVLLVQGTEDRVVDVDHYYRIVNVLEALGRPHETYLMQGTGHSPNRSESIDFAVRLRKFLSKHLGPR
jgi:dipeptidyl aminopeptidase/acylaminoacyl peptidase